VSILNSTLLSLTWLGWQNLKVHIKSCLITGIAETAVGIIDLFLVWLFEQESQILCRL